MFVNEKKFVGVNKEQRTQDIKEMEKRKKMKKKQI
jgi:hypothetical protein